MNRAPKGKADSSIKSKFGFNNNQTTNNNANNSNNVGQNNGNNDKEGEQENEQIIECMNILNEQEEAEQFVISLLEEIIWNAETLLFEKYIEKQIIPFTLNFFEKKIMEIVDWNFFKYDNGLINEDAWCPDEELEPIINDSWARGAIPVKQIPKRKSIAKDTTMGSKSHLSSPDENKKKHTSKKNETLKKNKVKKLKENIDSNTIPMKENSPTKKEKSILINDTKSKKSKNSKKQTIKNEKALSSREKQKSYTTKNAKNKIGISEIINNKQSTIQVQNMNKDGWNIENIYNYSGNLISTIKTSPDKTFEQNIRAQIVEPMKPKSRGKDKRLIISKNIPEKKVPREEVIPLSALNDTILSSDINALNNFVKQKEALSSEAKKTLRKKSIHSSTQKLLKVSKMKKNDKYEKLDPLLNYSKNDIDYNYEKYTEDISLEIPSFMNSINIAPGVKLYEGNSYKSGPSLNPTLDDKDDSPKFLFIKKDRRDQLNKSNPETNNELLKEIILRTNPSLKTSE